MRSPRNMMRCPRNLLKSMRLDYDDDEEDDTLIH